MPDVALGDVVHRLAWIACGVAEKLAFVADRTRSGQAPPCRQAVPQGDFVSCFRVYCHADLQKHRIGSCVVARALTDRQHSLNLYSLRTPLRRDQIRARTRAIPALSFLRRYLIRYSVGVEKNGILLGWSHRRVYRSRHH